jgi:dimethylaniline monooxygenase (N-oxide forming)
MSFTHINVSKYNYCFSDFPFPDDSVEFMHHSHIYEYAKKYVAKNELSKYIHFNYEVILVEGSFKIIFLFGSPKRLVLKFCKN